MKWNKYFYNIKTFTAEVYFRNIFRVVGPGLLFCYGILRREPQPNNPEDVIEIEILCLVSLYWTCSREEVTDQLVVLRPRKSPGLKCLKPDFQRLLESDIWHQVSLLNAYLRLPYFPQKWRKSTVIVISKPEKDLSCAGGLHSIRLLSTNHKILRTSRTKTYAESSRKLRRKQFDFHVIHQMIRTVESIAGGSCWY